MLTLVPEAEVEVEEVVEEAELWLSLEILFFRRSNSAIFLSMEAAEVAASLSAKSELKEAANWLKAASRGSEEVELGVEMVEEGEEKSRRELKGDEEVEDILMP